MSLPTAAPAEGLRAAVAGAQTRIHTPTPSEWRRLRRPSASVPSEKRTLDIITDHPMIPREHLARWLGVSEGRVSQIMRSLVGQLGASSSDTGQTWRHALHPVRRGHSLRHPQGPRPAAHDAGHLEHGSHHRQTGPQTARGPPHRDVGSPDEARRRHHVVPVAASGREPGPTPTATCCGPSPPPGPTGPTTGEIRPSPPTPWGT